MSGPGNWLTISEFNRADCALVVLSERPKSGDNKSDYNATRENHAEPVIATTHETKN